MVTYCTKMLTVCCITLAVVSTVFAHPAAAPPPEDDKAEKTNLKYTFGSKEEIPSAFFQSSPLETKNNESVTSERRAYPACQDGSGGMCVDTGTCPSNLKPEENVPGACASGQECCFGPPSTDKTCRSRGGECKARKQCGSAPTFLEAVDCDQKNGQICCILI